MHNQILFAINCFGEKKRGIDQTAPLGECEKNTVLHIKIVYAQ